MSKFLTPLRYPGGKQKLAPFVLEVLSENNLLGGHYAEPYAGGAGVAIELLLTGKVEHIHLNDVSVPVYAFWRSVLTSTTEFCRLISSASLTIKEWQRQKEILTRPWESSQLELGFSFFYLNRCNRSGIPTAGVIGGKNQNGVWKMDARFPRNELIRRVEAIGAKHNSITLRNWDAERFIIEHLRKLPERSLVYFDPPYFHKADRLYLNHYKPKDHARISKVIQDKVKCPWIISYDFTHEILNFYTQRRSITYELQYNAGTAYKGREIIILSDSVKLPKQTRLPALTQNW